MRYARVETEDGSRLLAVDDGEAYDLTTASDGAVRTIADLAREDAATDSLDAAATAINETPTDEYDLPAAATVPVESGEIWAADSTYERSLALRQEHSTVPAVYESVLDAERPELLLKATPQRTVGYDEAVGIRGDSDRNVAEASLAVVCCGGSIVGYTIGIALRSRSIEAANPLYVQQACTFDRCCALGPTVVSAGDVEAPHSLDVSMTVHSSGARVYQETGTTADLRHDIDELTAALDRHQRLPDPTVLLTGGAVVPGTEFTLAAGDEITVQIEPLGALVVTVTTV